MLTTQITIRQLHKSMQNCFERLLSKCYQGEKDYNSQFVLLASTRNLCLLNLCVNCQQLHSISILCMTMYFVLPAVSGDTLGHSYHTYQFVCLHSMFVLMRLLSAAYALVEPQVVLTAFSHQPNNLQIFLCYPDKGLMS